MLKKFFMKRFKFFFGIMLIPIIFLTVLSSIYLYHNGKNTIIKESASTLSQVSENLEMVISNSAYQYELLTYNPRLVLSLEKLLRHNSFDYTDVVFLNSMKTLLNAVAQSHDYIESIYMYLDGFDNFFSSEDGILDIHSAKDREWYLLYQSESIETQKWIQRREYQEFSYAAPEQVISLFHRITNKQGVIVVNVSIKQFEKVLNSNSIRNNEYIYLLNKNLDIICNNIQGNSLSSELQHFLKKQNTYKGNELISLNGDWVTVGKQTFLFESVYDPTYDIAFASLVPLTQIIHQQHITFLLLLGVILSNCLITLFLSYCITNRNFQQIEYIIQTFDNAEKGIIPEATPNTANDEYDIILNNVINVFLKSTYLRHQLTEKELKQEIAELAALQLQINPHFLFNTLQALDFEALKITRQPGNMNQMIQDLSSILKYALENPILPVQLKDELDYLKKYIDIQKNRYGDHFIIYYEIDASLLAAPVMRLMLQPLVENSISHGISALESTGYIKVRACRIEQNIQFVVIDNGIGLTHEELSGLRQVIQSENSKNIGLNNINRRLTLKYGLDSGLRIQSKKGMGTCISFRIPYTG